MQTMKFKDQNSWIVILILVPAFVWMLGSAHVASAGYADSAHGDTSTGVNRLTAACAEWPGGICATGSCAYCHDTFDPAICGVNALNLFSQNTSTSQTENFCYQCHDGTATAQSPAFNNYNYSYRASGDTSITCPSNVLEGFSFINESGNSVLNCGSTYGTAHHLTDIKNFIAGKWGYTADSNPCTACHNLHLAQSDPHAAGNRGWPVSRPSDHSGTFELWGDEIDERMSQYSTYQAPAAASEYEPDGSTTEDGSNLTDYTALCTDCHNLTNTIYSTVLGRNLRQFDWNLEKHGGGAATADYDKHYINGYCNDVLLPPYDPAQCGVYVLACTDCHEPHGSPNIRLIREKVNNGTVSVLTGDGPDPSGRDDGEWTYLCGKCHDYLLQGGFWDVHPHPDYIGNEGDEADGTDCQCCHPDVQGGTYYLPCGQCHYHGNTTGESGPPPVGCTGPEHYGEPLL